MSEILEKYTELREELDNKDPLVRYARLKEELDNKDPLVRYAQIKEELVSIKEENARKFEKDIKKREESTLEAMKSLFHSLGEEEVEVVEQPIIVSDEEVENVDIQEKQQQEEQSTEEIELSEPDIAEEITTVDQVSKIITKHEKDKEVKEEISPIQVKINILEQQIKQLFLDKSILGGGLDPNKISAHLIPTTANTFDLGSSERPWRDVHLSGATLVIGGTEIASSELTVLDNVTAGTISASKAVIVDSNKDIDGFRNVNAASYSIGGVAITSTAAELNIMDGVTSTTAELNLLDMSTASGASSSTYLRGDGTWQTISGSGHTIQNAGSNLTSRTGLNFDGTYVIVTDDSGNNQSDVALSSALQAWHSKARPSGVVIGTTDSQTLTNKTLTSSVLNTGVSGTAVLDEDDLSSDSATQLATQQSIKAYVDSQTHEAGDITSVVAGTGLTGGATSGAATLNVIGGTGITANADDITIDATVTTLTDSQTLTNKTLTSPVLNTGVSGSAVLDEDDMASDSATKLSTQQSIKAYVDARILTEDTIAELNDTTISSPVDGHFLVHTGSAWVNEDASTALASLGVTSTAAELNILDGVTTTSAELNLIDGATLTTNEMNLLDVSSASNASSSTFLRGDGSWQAVTGGGASLAFKTISISGQSDVVAESTTDTLTFIASGDTTITTNAGNDSITIDTTVTEIDGGNF